MIVSLLIFYLIQQSSTLLFACIQACVLESPESFVRQKNRTRTGREREREKRKEKGGKTRVEREEVKKEKDQELDDDQQECPYVRSIS